MLSNLGNEKKGQYGKGRYDDEAEDAQGYGPCRWNVNQPQEENKEYIPRADTGNGDGEHRDQAPCRVSEEEKAA